jgi:hypothetical protein
VWEISEHDIKSLNAMNLVPPKDLGFQESKVSKSLKISIQALLKFLVFRDALGVSGAS